MPASIRSAVQNCRACDLREGATQAVMEEGARRASVMLVGERIHLRFFEPETRGNARPR
jgi:uracil-DNA glycosylase